MPKNRSRLKHLIYFFYLIFFLSINIQGINAQIVTNKTIHISGKLKKAKPPAKITLYEIELQGFKPIDSVVVKRAGKFEFSVNTNETIFLLLRTSKDEVIKLIASPGDNLFIEGIFDKLFETYSVTGSFDSELLRQMDKKVVESSVKVKQISDFYKQSVKNQGNKKIKDSLDVVFNNISIDLKMFLVNIIKENPTSLASLTAINQVFGKNQLFTPEKDDALFSRLSMALINKYPENKHVRAFYRNVEDFMKIKGEADAIESRTGIGVKAPDIVLSDKDSNRVSLSQLKGKTLLVRFWNPSCDVCRAENRKLLQLYQKYIDRGFEVFEVSIGTKRDEWLIVMGEDKTNIWTNVKIPEEGDNIPNLSSYYVWLYGVKSVPYSFLINKEGVVVNKGFKTDDLDDMLKNLIVQ